MAVELSRSQGASIGGIMAASTDYGFVQACHLGKRHHVGTKRHGQDRLEVAVDAAGLGHMDHVLQPQHHPKFLNRTQHIQGIKLVAVDLAPLLLDLSLDLTYGVAGEHAFQLHLLIPEPIILS